MNSLRLVFLASLILALFNAGAAPVRGSSPQAPSLDKFPPDDPADVKTLQKSFRLTTDAQGSVAKINVTTDDLSTSPGLLPALSRLRHVRGINVYGDEDTDHILATMVDWPNLTNFFFIGGIGDDELAKLERHQSLSEVDIYSDRITNRGLSKLAKLKALKYLYIGPQSVHGEPKIDGNGLRELSGLKSLTKLLLQKCQIGDEGMRNLRGLRLKMLDIQPAGITDNGLAVIKEMTSLEELYLSHTMLTDAAFRTIRNFTSLRRLRIADSKKITGCGLSEIASLPLESLCVTRCPVVDDSLRNLKGMRLKELYLSGTSITDRGIENIAEMTTLERLDLKPTNITKASLGKLKPLKRLKIDGISVDNLP